MNSQKSNDTKTVAEKVSDENTIDFSKYTFNTANKEEQKLQLQKRKKYLLDFWYIECAPCVEDHKTLQKNLTKLADKNIEVIGLSIDRSVKDWRKYLSEHDYNWQQYNQYFQKPNLKKDLEIKRFPRYYLVNHSGTIQKQTNSLAEILDYLKIQ